MNGILLVNKEKNMTSRDMVNQVCQILHTKKIGHTGTLDPIATGVMVLCVGNTTKLVEIVTAHHKEYIAEVMLGVKTDTQDITGTILEEQDVNVTKEMIEQACHSMVKTYQQTVPIYSAVKIRGKKLYEYAREGKEVNLPSRDVTIESLTCISDINYIDGKPLFTIQTKVSKGTYIRSLIEDLAVSLGTIGTMVALTRIKQGQYTIEECVTLQDIKEGKYQLKSIENIISQYETIVVSDEIEKKVKNGALLPKQGHSKVVLLKNKEGLSLALYQTYDKDYTQMKPWKMLI